MADEESHQALVAGSFRTGPMTKDLHIENPFSEAFLRLISVSSPLLSYSSEVSINFQYHKQ